MERRLLVALFWVSLVGFSEANAGEATSSGSARGSNPTAPQGPDCDAMESAFRDHIVKNINAKLPTYETQFKCLTNAPVSGVNCELIRKVTLAPVNSFRDASQKLYQEIANKWKERDDMTMGGLIGNCFSKPDGSIGFKDHIRSLKTKQNDPTLCVGAEAAWQRERETEVPKYLNGQLKSDTVSAQQLSEMNKAIHSPLFSFLSDEAMYNHSPAHNSSKIQSLTASAMNNMIQGIKSLRDKLKGLQNHNLYQIYDFQNQFEKYKASLDERSRQNMQQCYDQSGFTSNCTSKGGMSRCGDKIWKFALGMAPILPLVDGMSMMQEIRNGVAAGVVTADESIARNSEAMLNSAMALSVVGGVGRAGTKAGQAIARRGVQKSKGLAVTDVKIAMSPVERAALLRRTMGSSARVARKPAENMRPRMRLQYARDVLGRDLSRPMQQAIINAHNLPLNQLKSKVKILKEAGFSRTEIEQLMDRGITGKQDSAILADLVAKDGDNWFEKMLERADAEKPLAAYQAPTPLQSVDNAITINNNHLARVRAEIADLESQSNPSARALADARRRETKLLSHSATLDMQRFEVTGGKSELDKLLEKQPHKPKDNAAQAKPKPNNDPVDLSEYDDALNEPLSDEVAAGYKKNQEQLEAEAKKDFDRMMQGSVAPNNAITNVLEQYKYASRANPIDAIYVSPKTGESVKVDIIGIVGERKGNDTIVKVRYRTEDGRVVTRDASIESIQPAGSTETLGMTSPARGVDAAVNRMAIEAQSNRAAIAELDRASTEARRNGAGWDEMNRIATARVNKVRADAPLAVHEVDTIRAVTQEYTPQGMVRRLPLPMSNTGRIKLRATDTVMPKKIGLTPTESADIQEARDIISLRNGAARVAEDKDYFDAVAKIDEVALVKSRIGERQREIAASIRQFTGSNSMEMPRYASYNKYDPQILARAMGSDGKSTSVKTALRQVHDIVTNTNAQLDSDQVAALQSALGTLRNPRFNIYVEGNPSLNIAGNADLRNFLDYAANRAGHAQLNLMRYEVKP